MRTHPSISIVIPVYNCELYIERCVNSCLAQEFTHDFEIVICNDASTDRTESVINGLFSNIPEIKVITNSSNQGIAITRNNCIRIAKGRYIFLLDGDDYIHPKTLNLLFEAIELVPTAQVVYSDYIYVDDKEQKSSQVDGSLIPIACGRLISKFVFVQHGLYADMRISEEREFLKRLGEVGIKMLHLPLPLYRYRQHDLSVTAEFQRKRLYDE